MNDDEREARQRRQAARLGLALGGVVLAILATALWVFTRAGLPKDPEMHRRQVQDAGEERPR
jgi:hypothetical protein